MDIYLHVLRSFVPNALNVVEKIRTVSEETLQDYAVNVHGLKGICAGIGAEKIKDAAYDLEMKAKYRDLAGILKSNETLINDAKVLISNIQKWFDEQENTDFRPVVRCPDTNLLIRLRECCIQYDMNGADEIMDELQSSKYEENSLVEWLREKIDESDFDAVVERLSEYEKE
jgi:HPt (histidine-containing phosphotransfer) domain-containing protein